MWIFIRKECSVICIWFPRMCASFLSQVKLRLQTHYQNIESLVSIYEDLIVKVRKLEPSIWELCVLFFNLRLAMLFYFMLYIFLRAILSEITLKSAKKYIYQKLWTCLFSLLLRWSNSYCYQFILFFLNTCSIFCCQSCAMLHRLNIFLPLICSVGFR
jgi:hypothetical protein